MKLTDKEEDDVMTYLYGAKQPTTLNMLVVEFSHKQHYTRGRLIIALKKLVNRDEVLRYNDGTKITYTLNRKRRD